MRSHIDTHRGFTLVEMIIAVGLFSIVMLVSVSALLALVNANRKAQALQSVMNNLNISVDSMVRSIREGTTYHCGSAGSFPVAEDCAEGDTLLAFEPFHSSSDPAAWLFWFAEDEDGIGRLYKSEDGTTVGGLPITSPSVNIESVTFYVIGTTRADTTQPRVTVVIKGTAGTKTSSQTTFHIQATAVQRVLDL